MIAVIRRRDLSHPAMQEQRPMPASQAIPHARRRLSGEGAATSRNTRAHRSSAGSCEPGRVVSAFSCVVRRFRGSPESSPVGYERNAAQAARLTIDVTTQSPEGCAAK
jgi:hypothetical protein